MCAEPLCSKRLESSHLGTSANETLAPFHLETLFPARLATVSLSSPSVSLSGSSFFARYFWLMGWRNYPGFLSSQDIAIPCHDFNYHQHASDFHIFMVISDLSFEPQAHITDCTMGISTWISHRHLKFNTRITEFLLSHTPCSPHHL